MTKKVIVLGCGMVGSAMARDLAADDSFSVTVADVDEGNLRAVASQARMSTKSADLGDTVRLRSLIEPFDLVVGALPSRLAFAALRTVIEVGKPYCDISFMPEDMMELDGLAKERGVTAVVDCGVSPGLSNMMIAHAHGRFDLTERAVIYVGGLPKSRRWPFQYKAPFAPADVIELYTRPARMVEHGQVVVKPALTEPEMIDFPRVGTLEAFNTDGLRSLLDTVDVPNMAEKTLRYPGHRELMHVFREAGLFNKETVEVERAKVRPLDVTSKLLFPRWRFEPGEEEFTILRVVVEGQREGRRERHVYDLYDEYDRATAMSSMARTTGFPNVIVARMLARGDWDEPGVFPPELLVRREGVFEHVLSDLRSRGVVVTSRVESLAEGRDASVDA